MTDPTREELDWAQWSVDWRAERPAPAIRAEEIHRAVHWGTLRLGAISIADLLWSAGTVALSLLVFSEWRDLVMLVWLVAIWSFTAARIALAFRNRQGLWSPRAPTVAGFLDLQVRRSRAKLRTVTIVRALILAETVFLIPFGCWEVAAHPGRYQAGVGSIVARYGTIGVSYLSIMLWSIWFRRRATSELSWYEPLARSATERLGGDQ